MIQSTVNREGARLMGRAKFAEVGFTAINPFIEFSVEWYAWNAGYGDAAREADGGTGHRAPMTGAEIMAADLMNEIKS